MSVGIYGDYYGCLFVASTLGAVSVSKSCLHTGRSYYNDISSFTVIVSAGLCKYLSVSCNAALGYAGVNLVSVLTAGGVNRLNGSGVKYVINCLVSYVIALSCFKSVSAVSTGFNNCCSAANVYGNIVAGIVSKED